MPHNEYRHWLLGLVVLLGLPMPALAIPAITCHCFTDRAYDPARPAAADPYFLANAQNSFLAAAFNVDKKTIVLKKQRGTSSDDMWVAYGAASRSGVSADALLQAKQTKDSWKEAFTSLGVNTKPLGTRSTTALNSKEPAARLAEAVVDELLTSHRLLSEAELSALRKSGATNQEAIISALLAMKTKQPARQILLQVKNGSTSWGSLLSKAKIEPADLQKEFAALVRAR